MKKIPPAHAVVAADLQFEDGHIEIYSKADRPVALVLWSGNEPMPALCLKAVENGDMRAFSLMSDDDLPQYDARQTLLHREVDVQRRAGEVVAVRVRQNGVGEMAFAHNGFPDTLQPFNVRANGIFADGYVDRDGLPVGDTAAYRLKASLYGASARDWSKARLAAVVAQFSSAEIADALEGRFAPRQPRQLMYGVCSDGLYFAALYDPNGVPAYKETGITLGRIAAMLGQPVADLIARDAGEPMGEPYFPNYRELLFLGSTHDELREGARLSAPYDPDDMDAAVEYRKKTNALFAGGKIAEAHQMYLRDPNGGAAPGMSALTLEHFEATTYGLRDVQGRFLFPQQENYSLDGFTVGHKARPRDDGPWGRIEQVARFNDKTYVSVVFDEPVPDDSGKPCERLLVEGRTVSATKRPEFEIRRMADDRHDSSYSARWHMKGALDEIDGAKPLSFYGIDLDTGRRFVSFNGMTELKKQGLVEKEFFEQRDADAGQRRSRKMSCGM